MKPTKYTQQHERTEILNYLKKGYFLKLCSRKIAVKLYDQDLNPIKYYNRATFNTLLDEKLIIQPAGDLSKFILNQ